MSLFFRIAFFASLSYAFAATEPSAAFGQTDFEKLPYSINTPDKSELLPVISADGSTLYFTRTRMGLDSSAVFDIWRSHVYGDSSFSAPEFIGGNLASSFGIAVTSIAPDNNTLYLIGKMRSDSPPEDRVYVTHKIAGGWSIPEAQHIQDLRAKGVATDYAFGPDQRTLILSVNRDSSLGDRDLYVSFFDEASHSWSAPRWLGPDVNSDATEMTPYLASDNKTLYFSSNRSGGIGEVDVYRSTRLDDTWKHWSRPEDLGWSVNRPGRTTYYVEDAAGKYAYVSWRKTIGDQSDIYRVKVEHRRAIALVRGIVHDAEGKPLGAKVFYSRLRDGTVLGSAHSDPGTGEYQLTLPAGEDYSLRAERDGYFPTSERIDLTTLTGYIPIHKDLRLDRITAGAAITLKNVFFETDKSTLLPASYPELERVRELLASHPEYRLEIDGHTDNTGSDDHNMRLAKSRAEAVANYLAEHGIDAKRMTAKSFGSSKPVATNATEEGRAQNRRVEFILLGQK